MVSAFLLCLLAAQAAGECLNPPCPGKPRITPGCLAPDGQTDLWCPGQADYECYKIPTLLRIPNSTTLLAFIEARKYSCDDAGYVDILQKRSHDDGKTWSEASKVYGDSNEKEWHTIGDALPVFDAHTGIIHLVFTRDNKDAFLSHSDNQGLTWSTPTNITDVVAKKRGGFCGTGHANGVQFKSGRLFVPMYGCGANSFSLVSDDHGKSWKRTGSRSRRRKTPQACNDM